MNTNVALVSELRNWIGKNRERLEAECVSITDKLPDREENEQIKGCIGLTKGHILISFTAWERQPTIVELLVYNTHLDKTVVMRDYNFIDVEMALEELTDVSRLLVKGDYDDMNPDPDVFSS